ncbi:hypothetical protein M5D96_003509, partial [Drosophila gunungcola]
AIVKNHKSITHKRSDKITCSHRILSYTTYPHTQIYRLKETR